MRETETAWTANMVDARADVSRRAGGEPEPAGVSQRRVRTREVHADGRRLAAGGRHSTTPMRASARASATVAPRAGRRGRARARRDRGCGAVTRATGARAVAADDATQDASARAMALAFATIADDTRAVEIEVLAVSKKVYYARYVVIATAFNRPQMNAICAKLRDEASDSYGLTVPKSAAQQGDWACLDCADVVVHVFSPTSRTHYDLDGLYRGAERVPLPFVTETRGNAPDEFEYADDTDEELEEEDEFEVFR